MNTKPKNIIEPGKKKMNVSMQNIERQRNKKNENGKKRAGNKFRCIFFLRLSDRELCEFARSVSKHVE